jgi:hypothetical protein
MAETFLPHQVSRLYRHDSVCRATLHYMNLNCFNKCLNESKGEILTREWGGGDHDDSSKQIYSVPYALGCLNQDSLRWVEMKHAGWDQKHMF